MTATVRPASGHTSADIYGVDPSRPLSDEDLTTSANSWSAPTDGSPS